MKKTISLLLCLMLVFSVGCSQTIDPSPTNDKPAESSGTSGLPADYDLTIVMGGQTGSVYAMGIQMGEYLRKIENGVRTTVKAGSGGTNILSIAAGQADIGHTGTDTVYFAYNQLDKYEGKDISSLRGVAKVMQNAFHFVVPADSSINTFKDIVTQQYPLKISVGKKGSGIEGMFKKMLELNGATYEDIESWGGKIEYIGFSEAVTLYKDGQLNALTIASGIPYSHVTDVSTAKDVKFIAIPDETVEKLTEFGFSGISIPAGTYKGQEEEIKTFGSGIIIVANENTDETVVYELTKYLNDPVYIEELGAINKGFSDYMKGPETGIKGFDYFDLHDGAKRYYKEAGVLK